MSVQDRIYYFNFIKNIPYKIGVNGVQDYCCASKSEMLARLLEGLGLETRQVRCKFNWTETPIPQDILDLPREAGETHRYMQALIPETSEWVNVDPTWDADLEKAGFPIATWDGLNETKLAVTATHIYSAEETHNMLSNETDSELEEHFKFHADFYDAINKWMMSYR